MKILITGGSGMLAAEIILRLSKDGHEVIVTDLNPRNHNMDKLDIVDSGAVVRKIEDTCPDYVFHLAAETDVDLCERKPEHAFRVNTLGTENIALACQQQNIILVYVSTASVFSGCKTSAYIEFDSPGPVNIYGQSKLQGELIVKDLLTKYFIIRAGWMVGGWEIDKKFVYKIISQLKEGRKELMAVADKFGSPTFTKDFANNLIPLINTKRYGLYHMSNTGVCSRYDMAVKIIDFMGLNGKVKVHAVNSDQFSLPAPRPNSEMLCNYKLDMLGLNNMPAWEDSLKEYIKANKKR